MAKKNSDYWDMGFTESYVVERTTIEQYLDIDESLMELEKKDDLIRLDMNTIEFPIFSKDSKRTKNQTRIYYFKTDKSSYLEVAPASNYSIPGEFEERVFIALTKIMRNNNYGRSFVTSANEIINNLNVKNNKGYYPRLKNAIKTLANSVYRFKNAVYSNELKGIINDEIHTTIMSIRIIVREDNDSSNYEEFNDGRIKELYKISFNDYFYNNIITKGYLAFDSEKLLSIGNAVTRSIYTILEKWRGYDLYLKRPAFFIARRIPLAWDKTQISRTIKIMEKSCNELVKMGFIKHFNVIKESKWELANFEFFFEEEHNKTKKDTFFKEKKEFNNFDMQIALVENKVKDKDIIDIIAKNEIDELEINKVLSKLPEKAKSLNTLKKDIEEAILKYGLDYVLATADYVKKKKPKSLKAYFNKALKEHWAEEYRLDRGYNEKLVKHLFDIEEPKQVDKNVKSKEIEKNYNDFLNLSEEEQNKIEEEVKNKYLKQGGHHIAFKHARRALISDYMTLSYEDVKKEEKLKINAIDEDNKLIEKEYENFSMFLFEVLDKLSDINLSENDTQKILKILPILKSFQGTINNYKINLKYDEENKIGKIDIK